MTGCLLLIGNLVVGNNADLAQNCRSKHARAGATHRAIGGSGVRSFTSLVIYCCRMPKLYVKCNDLGGCDSACSFQSDDTGERTLTPRMCIDVVAWGAQYFFMSHKMSHCHILKQLIQTVTSRQASLIVMDFL